MQSTPKNSFEASDGQTYVVAYDLPLVRDIRKAIGINLLSNEGIAKASADPIDFAEVLWHTCRQQAEREGIDEADFVRSIQDRLDDCVNAWLEGIADFFAQIGRSALARLARVLVETEQTDRREANRLMTDTAARKVADRQLKSNSSARRRALDDLLGDKSGNETKTPGLSSPS